MNFVLNDSFCSMFSDLCSSSKAGNPLPTIDRFLLIYEDAMKWITISESLSAARSTSGPNEAISMDKTKPVSLWVEAALATDLEVVSLVNSIDGYSKQKFSGKPSIAAGDNSPRMTFSKKNSLVTLAKNQAKAPSNMWSRGQCVGETVSFAKSLRHEMQSWFMKFVEDALDVGFQLYGEVLENGREASCKDNGRVAAVLSQLKRVNDWLDAVGKKPEVGKKSEEEMILVEKIERLKRKIYGFVITHVGSAFDSSVSLSKVV